MLRDQFFLYLVYITGSGQEYSHYHRSGQQVSRVSRVASDRVTYLLDSKNKFVGRIESPQNDLTRPDPRGGLAWPVNNPDWFTFIRSI